MNKVLYLILSIFFLGSLFSEEIEVKTDWYEGACYPSLTFSPNYTLVLKGLDFEWMAKQVNCLVASSKSNFEYVINDSKVDPQIKALLETLKTEGLFTGFKIYSFFYMQENGVIPTEQDYKEYEAMHLRYNQYKGYVQNIVDKTSSSYIHMGLPLPFYAANILTVLSFIEELAVASPDSSIRNSASMAISSMMKIASSATIDVIAKMLPPLPKSAFEKVEDGEEIVTWLRSTNEALKLYIKNNQESCFPIIPK